MLDGLTLHPKLREAALTAIDAWSRNRTWATLGIDDAASMRTAIVLAQAIVDGSHRGLDYRTFSRRTVANSKALEKLEAAVLRLITGVVDVPPSSGRVQRLRLLVLNGLARRCFCLALSCSIDNPFRRHCRILVFRQPR
ncbi:hypothetical protein LZK73_23890 [Neorhizobium galegae]|nr:hypothetical protein LZK73_23890 [Neorhizobium galegae]